jgi:hypothetical protein
MKQMKHLKYTLVDMGHIGFPNDTTASCGLWPGPRTEAGRGATTATPNPSRIG